MKAGRAEGGLSAGAPASGGTYVLLLRAPESGHVQVGRLGRLELVPGCYLYAGCYLYVGSAFGPGGLPARLHHHERRAARPHWHIDYLRRHTELEAVWCTAEARRHEHVWAQLLGALPDVHVPVPGFGASDCRCAAHLFACARPPRLASFQRLARAKGAAVPRAVRMERRARGPRMMDRHTGPG